MFFEIPAEPIQWAKCLFAYAEYTSPSKMLGHRELKTTQVYAKIIDQTKREAADKIKLEM